MASNMYRLTKPVARKCSVKKHLLKNFKKIQKEDICARISF